MFSMKANIFYQVIAKSVGGTSLESLWASISFMLVVTIAQPIYSSASDVLGRKNSLYMSMLLFTLGSLVFAVAKSMRVIILGRVLQGLGGGGMDVLQVIILSDVTTLRERPLYMGVIAVFNALGNIIGLVAAGVFAELVSWRWLGWVNLPLMGVAFLLTFFFLHLKLLEMDTNEKFRHLDWLGLILFATGATSLALPLSWAGSSFSWSTWQTLLPLLIGVALLSALAWYERRPLEPVFPHRIFKNITTTAAILSGAIHGLLTYTVQTYLPLFFQAVFLQTTIQSAISTLPFSAVVVGFSAISGILVHALRRYRLLLLTGWLLMTTFLGLLVLVKRRTTKAETYIFQAFAGIGVGIILTVTAIPTQASVRHVDDTGIAAGMLVNFRLFGALIGLTIGSNIFNSVFKQKMDSLMDSLTTLPTSIQILQNANEAIGFIPSLRTLELPEPLMNIVLDAFWAPFQVLWIVMTCISGVGFFIALFIKELSLEKDEVGRQRLQQPLP
jgi:predicted MFS family arabinose efflux permease